MEAFRKLATNISSLRLGDGQDIFLARFFPDTPPPQNCPSTMISPTAVTNRLDQIDKIRAHGVGKHIALPQLVVCGDQSAGKSSVLEEISGIPFPRNEGLCTKFATEIILRHTVDEEEPKITASIRPCTSREKSKRARLEGYCRRLLGYDELPGVVQEVSTLMGLRGPWDEDGATFAADVLLIEVTGQTGLHLTVVDLSGLIEGSGDDGDRELVNGLVDSYLENSRTIVLAVVTATSDIETQSIIRHARQFDKEGVRTVGIITKPDLINEGRETYVATVANNKGSVKLKRGFSLLKNPSPGELDEGVGFAERKEKEKQFFKHSKWQKHSLNLSRVGVDALRSFLQTLLEEYIEK